MKSTLLALIGLGMAALPAAAQHQQGMDRQVHRTVAHCQTMQSGMAMMGHMMMGGRGMMGDSMPAMGQQGMTDLPMRGVMMQGMRLWPQYLIEERDALGLTDDQVSRLEALQDEQPMPMDGMADLRAARQQLTEAFESGDAETIRAATKRVAEVQAGMQASHLTVAAQARGILTEEQRATLEDMPGPCGMPQGGHMQMMRTPGSTGGTPGGLQQRHR